MRRRLLLAVIAAAASAPASADEPDADATRAIALRYFHPTRSALEDLRERGLEATGLRPVYPAGAECPPASSLFADRTRGDGSTRNPRFFHGHHGGLDIPAPEGTPILAIADGTVVAKKPGSDDGIGGIELIVQHAPADTGLGSWLYSKYKHLKEMPALEPGARVRRGQPIALTGSTGTAGKHYGSGHAHLHLDTFASPDDKHASRVFFFPLNGRWVDPLAVFRGAPLDTAAVRALPDAAKQVTIPYQAEGGAVVPATSRVTWPYACKPAAPPL
jgi:murein DD-endopeptidase MepM/ murein hydrolase activator NlpD